MHSSLQNETPSTRNDVDASGVDSASPPDEKLSEDVMEGVKAAWEVFQECNTLFDTENLFVIIESPRPIEMSWVTQSQQPPVRLPALKFAVDRNKNIFTVDYTITGIYSLETEGWTLFDDAGYVGRLATDGSCFQASGPAIDSQAVVCCLHAITQYPAIGKRLAGWKASEPTYMRAYFGNAAERFSFKLDYPNGITDTIWINHKIDDKSEVFEIGSASEKRGAGGMKLIGTISVKGALGVKFSVGNWYPVEHTDGSYRCSLGSSQVKILWFCDPVDTNFVLVCDENGLLARVNMAAIDTQAQGRPDALVGTFLPGMSAEGLPHRGRRGEIILYMMVALTIYPEMLRKLVIGGSILKAN
ncbi:hypothetical protein B0H11DRAFT_2105134, partial [Mycena galericulata]